MRGMHQGSGSRGRVARRRTESDADLMELHPGSSPCRNQISSWDIPLDSFHRFSSSVEENSFALEFRRNSSKKTSGIPMKMLIDEEVSKNIQIRHSSPSIVARLMGLDSLPPCRGVCAQQKKMERTPKASISVCSQGKQNLHENLSHRRSIDELPELKDVFEVMETSQVKMHKNLKDKKGKVSSKYSETDIDFIRQKLRDARRLFSDEQLQSCSELNDASGELETNKDLFLEFLREPNSLFTKHLHELSSSPPSPHPSQITILKPSKFGKLGKTEIISRRGKDSELCTHKPKEIRGSSKKPTTSPIGHSFEHCDFRKHKLSKSSYERTEAHVHPTRIVVLKPSLAKGQNIKEAVSSANSIFQSDYRRSSDFPDSGIPRLYTEGCEQQKLPDGAAVLRPRTMGSREITRVAREQMRETVSDRAKVAFESELSNHVGDERILECVDIFNYSEALHRSSHLYDDWSCTFRSSMHSTESSVSKEARKRLSERWMMTHQSQELGPVVGGSSTLGEMLALSDRETPRATKCAMDSQNGTLSNDSLPCMSVYPLGISSKDGWQDENLRNITRFRSLPALSTRSGCSKQSNRKRVHQINDLHMHRVVSNIGADNAVEDCFSRQGRSEIRSPKYHYDRACLEENILPEREIHVSSEESRISVQLTNPSEQRPTHAALFCDAFGGDYQVPDISMVSNCQNLTHTSNLQENKEQQPLASAVLVKDEAFIVPNLDGLVIEEGPPHHPQVDYVLSSCNAMGSASPQSPNEGERPSPAYVLDQEEKNSSAGCFGRISADLQELRMQLQLLKMESADTYADEPELFTLSDEESMEDVPVSETSQAFRNEDERDYSYLLDMVTGFGVRVTNQDLLFHACYSLDCPLDPAIFSKLEKKYSKLILWPRSERKLLFDLINSVLADILSSCMDLQPWMAMSWRRWLKYEREDLMEEVWRKVNRQKELRHTREAILEPRWLDKEGGVDIFVREMENMMQDHLLEELIADFILW